MGNLIGTISWTTSDGDIRYTNRLQDLSKRYGLRMTDHYWLEDEKKTYFDIEISGMSLWWKGETNANAMIKAFLFDAEEYLKKANANNIQTHVNFLPM